MTQRVFDFVHILFFPSFAIDPKVNYHEIPSFSDIELRSSFRSTRYLVCLAVSAWRLAFAFVPYDFPFCIAISLVKCLSGRKGSGGRKSSAFSSDMTGCTDLPGVGVGDRSHE
jgi:hypothetical protein